MATPALSPSLLCPAGNSSSASSASGGCRGWALDAKTRELVKLGMAIGARLEGAVHAHARRALEAGVTLAEIRHVVALAPPTVGFPTTVAAYTWVEEVLGKGTATRGH